MMFEDFPGWQAARAVRAAGPGLDAEQMRHAYLELLKLCLCDLAGTSTTSVGKRDDGAVAARPLAGEERRLRAAGMDWPLQGLTMVGLNRLDDLQTCVETVVREGVEGDLIEAGAWRGGASILMRATLDSLGAHERTLWVADSFQGFPMPDVQENLNIVDFLSVSLEEVEANFARFGLDRGVRFVPGFFEETLSGLSTRRWAVVRLDGDTYEATWLCLQRLYTRLAVGGYLVVDDYGALPECRRAVDEFRQRHGLTEPLEEVDWTCVRWRRKSDVAIENLDPPRRSSGALGAGSMRAVTRPDNTRVPTEQELELSRRCEAAEAEVARLRSSIVAGPRAWLARKVRRRGRA
jgi:O-methyltransferase